MTTNIPGALSPPGRWMPVFRLHLSDSMHPENDPIPCSLCTVWTSVRASSERTDQVSYNVDKLCSHHDHAKTKHPQIMRRQSTHTIMRRQSTTRSCEDKAPSSLIVDLGRSMASKGSSRPSLVFESIPLLDVYHHKLATFHVLLGWQRSCVLLTSVF
ncbi:hypothetical protein FA13DRAFT_1117654 [Coprinellus micaceus]|uniref:Uncharacterized protein n=1 Tax=Coprinellus micaceus TaxID=71717 RepID=A0A4Y7RK53_COPMI|nr:hypothetical protein FA13DRAFT_1117654 [Coprinellus micaceus]